MKIDYKDIYEGRIMEIRKQLRKAVISKSWDEKAVLEKEMEYLVNKIAQMR